MVMRIDSMQTGRYGREIEKVCSPGSVLFFSPNEKLAADRAGARAVGCRSARFRLR